MRDRDQSRITKSLAYVLIAYGTIGLPSTYFPAKRLFDILIDAMKQKSTWPLFQNWGIASVVGSSCFILTVWASLGFGLIVFRRPRILPIAIAFLGFCLTIKGICTYFIPNRGLSNFIAFQHITNFSYDFAAPIAFFIAALSVSKQTRRPVPIRHFAIQCANCGYDLHGLVEPRCPECGRVYTLDEFYHL